MADYTKQIFEMLGVEPEEEFSFGKNKSVYKLDRKLNIMYFAGEKFVYVSDYTILDILRGDLKIIKIPRPTAEEQLAIDYARACGFKWLAKDKNKRLTAFKEKPKKGIKEWLNTTDDFNDWIELYLPISFISWEDEEPYYIGD